LRCDSCSASGQQFEQVALWIVDGDQCGVVELVADCCPDLVEGVVVHHQAGARFGLCVGELDFEGPLIVVQKEALSLVGP